MGEADRESVYDLDNLAAAQQAVAEAGRAAQRVAVEGSVQQVGPVSLSSISATSEVAAAVVSKARRRDKNEESHYTWVANTSLKFKGC
jgi:hypothetical protein